MDANGYKPDREALVQMEKDAVEGPVVLDTLALVAAQTGQVDRAIVALQKLFSMPYISIQLLTPARFRLDPTFDPLRNDARFQKLCEEKQP